MPLLEPGQRHLCSRVCGVTRRYSPARRAVCTTGNGGVADAAYVAIVCGRGKVTLRQVHTQKSLISMKLHVCLCVSTNQMGLWYRMDQVAEIEDDEGRGPDHSAVPRDQ